MTHIHEQDVFRPWDEFEFADYGIVFGCDFHSEMKPRIHGGIELLRNGRLGALVLSGGATGDSNVSEAEIMESTAMNAGIAPDRLLLESASRTTQQNVLRCKELLDQRTDRVANFSIALITSDWHMARAWMIARKHFPPFTALFCAPQETTCNRRDWPESIQCACLIRSELRRVEHAMQKDYPDPRG